MMHSGIVARRNAKLDCIDVNGVDQIHRYNRITGLTADNCELRRRGEAYINRTCVDVSHTRSTFFPLYEYAVCFCSSSFASSVCPSLPVSASLLFPVVVIECISATVPL